MLRSLEPLWRHACLLYYARALKEINPMHPDVAYIVHRLNHLRRLS